MSKYVKGVKIFPSQTKFWEGIINIFDGFTFDGKWRTKDKDPMTTYHWMYVTGKLTRNKKYVSIPHSDWVKLNPHKHGVGIKIMEYGNKGIEVITQRKDLTQSVEIIGKERWV